MHLYVLVLGGPVVSMLLSLNARHSLGSRAPEGLSASGAFSALAVGACSIDIALTEGSYELPFILKRMQAMKVTIYSCSTWWVAKIRHAHGITVHAKSNKQV